MMVPTFDINEVMSTVYVYGNLLDQSYGAMVLRRGGTLVGYDHPNEQRWSSTDGRIQILDGYGNISRDLTYIKDINGFIGYVNKDPFYLYPSFTHTPRTSSRLPNIFINSIPKSGTYLLDRILSEVGWHSTKVHLLDGGRVDDYRGFAEEDMHVKPEEVRTRCPSKCLGAVLGHGEVVAGHLRTHEDVYGIVSEGVREVRLLRNLRDVICSLFRFRLNRVAPNPYTDEAWRNAEESEKFISFLRSIEFTDLVEIKEICEYFLQVPSFTTLRFEDMSNGNLAALLPLCYSAGIDIKKLELALERSLGKKTSTWSGGLTDWRGFWCDEVELIFKRSGLLSLNQRYGYEQL